MSSTLNVTKQLTNDGWVITATIDPGGTLPREIFVYENNGSNQLGPYQGVVAAIDIPRFQIWTGTVIAAFGNKYVRHSIGTVVVKGSDDPDAVIAGIKSSVESLSKQFQAVQNSTQVYTIT